ncbi:MAG: hypothetical protein HRU20_08295 [Pseudomonadales bacterium]|nr:hypothetical protein [Pseudomonadales bacterium]
MIDFDTLATDKDVQQLINDIDHTRRQHDAKMLVQLLEKITGHKAVIWGDDIIGFGQYKYAYKTGRTGFWPTLSFASTTENISVNVMLGFENYEKLLNKIGRVKHTNTTLILHKLSDIQMPALEELLTEVYADMKKAHKCA